MRPLQIAGLVLIAIGVWFIVRPPNYSSDEKVFKLGNIEAQMRRERSVPGWVGGIAVGAGVVLVLVGLKKR
jgi:drug/metabolite transporter (DMT)-like permease